MAHELHMARCLWKSFLLPQPPAPATCKDQPEQAQKPSPKMLLQYFALISQLAGQGSPESLLGIRVCFQEKHQSYWK